MTNVKTEAVFIEPGEGREFNYNKVYAKTLSEVVAKKLSAIESTTTVDYEMEAKLGSSVSWRLMQKLVALATRFDQFNSLPKVQSPLIGDIQFPSATFTPNGVLTILNDGSGTPGSVVDDVENILTLLHSYFELAERTVRTLSNTMALYYDDHRAVLGAIEKILKDISKEGNSTPKTFQNLKLKLTRHDYIRESGKLVIVLSIEL